MTISIKTANAVAPSIEDDKLLQLATQNLAKRIDPDSVALEFGELSELIDNHAKTFGSLPIQQCALGDYDFDHVRTISGDLEYAGECIPDSVLDDFVVIENLSQF